ncbi:S1C family serine protease [Cohnella nanjingensis]|uniref:Trypsin-like peptidase domain-containing protein n=1 Tax=Cohnella nanjingensis TaxID=1387779 RepID=A0A7X0RLR2_9BACL|nr:trypsin-like peptidase domain-containing protein [Cohnella nanjingensis]MBB6669666.1 trypsin-like peptidase domain-containing protein [Cohnella nanjingensis]
MDDQHKKPEEDFFGFRYGEQNEPKKSDAADQTETNGYAASDNESGYDANRQDPYGAARRDTEPYTFGPQRTERADEFSSGDAPDARTEVVPTATREYRPFTVSGGGRNWEAPKPPKRTSFRAMFAAFMVGVVAVGGLMFASDRYDWFSSKALESIVPAASASQDSGVKPVSNTTDVVRPNNIAKIFEQASPAVVKIETFVKASSRSSSPWDDNPFFRQFFGDDGQGGQGGQGNGSNGQDGALQEEGMGSGFIFDSTGYILTNQHVINGADEIKVTVTGHQEKYTAKLLGSSYDLDLAVLKIEGSDFPTLKLGDSGSANMGDWVVAIGNPYGFDHTVTVGVLSSNEREISIQDTDGTRNYQHLLQTDASINPGNSGGPLINLNGEVIGINTAVSSQAQGIGFAIPTSTITEVLENLKTNTKIPTKPSPFIGATLADVTAGAAKQLGLKDTNGSLVNSILYGSPAYKADIRQYDVILGMDGKKYNTKEELIAAIQKKNVGDEVKLDVYRDGKSLELTVKIGNKNDYEQQSQQQQQQQ